MVLISKVYYIPHPFYEKAKNENTKSVKQKNSMKIYVAFASKRKNFPIL